MVERFRRISVVQRGAEGDKAPNPRANRFGARKIGSGERGAAWCDVTATHLHYKVLAPPRRVIYPLGDNGFGAIRRGLRPELETGKAEG